MSDDCLFCKIIAGQLPSKKVFEDDKTVAFLDIHPVNPGHTLIVPKAHADTFLQSAPEDMQAVMATAKRLAPAILKSVGADACNVTTNCGRASGQIIFHTHFHVIPRFATDGYKAWQRAGDVHEDLTSLADKIRAAL